MIKIIFNE